MIIEKFAQLDESQRKKAAVSAVIVMGLICYFIIIRGPIVKLRSARASYTELQSVHNETEQQMTDLTNLQTQHEKKQKQLQKYQQLSFTREEALQFFENINATALIYNLKPISRIISKPENLFWGDRNKPQQDFLKKQSAKVTVLGDYFDIIDFLNDLVSSNKPQKVYITDMHIALERGENFHPSASFNAVLLVDSSDESEEK